MKIFTKTVLCVITALTLIISSMDTEIQGAAKKTKLNKTTLTMTVGQKKQIKLVNAKKLSSKKIKKVKWTSSDKTTASVKYKGKYRKKAIISANKSGKATIKVKYNGKSYRCKVTVQSNNPSEDSLGTASATFMPASPAPNVSTVTPTEQPHSNPEQSPDGSSESEYSGDDSIDGFTAPVSTVYSAEDTNTDSEGATIITIPKTASGEKTELGNYSISKKNKVTITASGTYIIKTENTDTASNGLLEVDYIDTTDTGTVHLILDNVNLTSTEISEPTSDKGLITIKKSVPKAIITLKENTTNTLTDTGACGIDEDDGVSTTYTAGIVSKKTPLTINGTGSLSISSVNGNGIKCTDELKILDADISAGTEVTPLGHNGITGKTNLSIKNALITIYSTTDALKTTLNETDIAEDQTLTDMGNMELNGGIYNIYSKKQDAISVYRVLMLNPESLTATAAYTSSSYSDSTSSKAVKAGTTIYISKTAGSLTLTSSRDDTLHCNRHILIEGGTITASAGDDGIHSDSGLQINGGVITITKSYEGLESGDITINGGIISITSSDDGLNAAGGNNNANTSGNFGPGGDYFNPKDDTLSDSANYQIIINGGTLTVDADGDGIDSNGNIFFRGGTVTVNGPTNSGNGALDYGDRNCVCEITGGTLIAAGAMGMEVAPTSGSSQPAVNVRLSSSMPALTYVVLKDSSNNTVMTARPTKAFQSVIMSCADLSLRSTYTVYYGSSLDNMTQGDSFTFSSVSVSTGSSTSSGGWNPGGWKPGGWN